MSTHIIKSNRILRLLHRFAFQRGCGDVITLGICPRCGRNVTHSTANKTGGRCRYDGAQYNAQGWFLW